MYQLEPSAPTTRGQIMTLLAAHPQMSRSDIAATLNIGPATASTQVRRLIENGWIREGKGRGRGAGRPSIPLEIVPNAGSVIGISVSPHSASLALTTLDCQIVSASHVKLPTNLNAMILGEVLRPHINALIDPAMPFWGAGISTSGVVDQASGAVAISVVHGWRNEPIGPTLSQLLRAPVRVANDVNAVAHRELLRSGPDMPTDFLILSLGEGVGMAMVRNHAVVSGQRGASTEFGHVSVDPLGPTCKCGNHGCPQSLVSLDALRAGIGKQLPNDHLSAIELAELVSADPRAARFAERAGYWLGRALGGTCTLLGLGNVIVTGESLPLWPHLEPGFSAGLAETVLTMTQPPTVIIRDWDPLAGAVGAAALLMVNRFNTGPA